jgi:urease subunit gamma
MASPWRQHAHSGRVQAGATLGKVAAGAAADYPDSVRSPVREDCGMYLTPRELDKLLIYSMAEVALRRKAKGLKLNHPEAVAVISAAALDGARAGKSLEDVMSESRTVLTRDDVMDGVADMIPSVQVEAVFTDGSRLVTLHAPIQ